MRVGRMIGEVLRPVLMCLIVGSMVGWSPSSAYASSTLHLLNTPLNFNFSQAMITETSPTMSQPASSPADGTWEVTGTIQLSGTERPLQIAISGGKAYVSRNPGHLTILDLSTNTPITTINFGPYPGSTPQHIAISGSKAYVALSNLGSDGQLAVINIANNTVSGYVPVGADPHGVAAAGQRVYVTNNVWWANGDPATVKVIDVNTNSVVATIPVGINPTSIAIDPNSSKAYVINHNDLSKSVSVIDTASNSVVNTVPISNPPAGVAISGNRAYVTTTVNMPNGTAEVINISSDTVVSSIPVGRDSWGIAASSSHVFVTNQASGTVSIIEVATNSVVATVSVGDDPTGIAADPSTGKVYVANQGDRTISIIEYREEAPPANQSPSVAITYPSNNAAVSGIVDVQGTASDPDGNSQLQRVEVKIDNGSWTQVSGTTSWSYSWNTATIADGQHSIRARSYDGQAYSTETSIVVNVNNLSVTPSLVNMGISSEAEPQPPREFLEAKPGDMIYIWYDIGYSGPRLTVRLRTMILGPGGIQVSNPLGDTFFVIMEDVLEHTGWVGVTFDIPDGATLGTYDVRFSIWSEDGTHEYEEITKPGCLLISLAEAPDIGPVQSMNFGNVSLDSSLDKTVTIYNEGNATLTINSIIRVSGSTDYTYVGPDTPFDIASGSSQPITIRFTPSSKEQKIAVFSINSNDPDEANIALNVSGNGVIQTGVINVTSDPSGASFTLSGTEDYSGITPWSTTDALAGSYTITWIPMSGFETPLPETKTLIQGDTLSFYGPYTRTEETISTPNTPIGPSSGQVNQSLTYSIGGASSSMGHNLQYRFDWGDGSLSNWSSSASASRFWSNSGTYIARAQARCAIHTSVLSEWSSGLRVNVTAPLPTSVTCFDDQTCYSTKEAAVSHVPDHVVPRDCFVWNDGPPDYQWRVIPGYGCAHWVAHQLGIRVGTTCYDGYSIRVKDVIAGRAEVGIKSCKVGDIWTNNDETHCGIIRQLGDGKILVEHDSSAEGGVVMSWVTSGKYWSEPPLPEAESFPGEKAATLWDYYSAWGKQLPPLSERAKMYEALGLGTINDYTGTAEQNTRLLNALKQRQICPSTGEEVGWAAIQSTLAQLIQQQATGGIPVTVDGQDYIILTLKNRIDPATLKVLQNSGITKVYVYGDSNSPVSDREIVQKIGLIDYVNQLQRDNLEKYQLAEKIDNLTKKIILLSSIQFGEDSIEILLKVPTSISIGALVDLIGEEVAEKFFHKLNDLQQELLENLYNAGDDYNRVLHEVVRNELGFTDYDTAYVVLENYLSGVSYEERYSFLYGMLYGRYPGGLEALGRAGEMALSSFTLSISDQLLAGAIENDYETFCKNEDYRLQLRLAKLYEAAPYTLMLANSPRITSEVHSPVELRVYDSEQRVTGIVNGEEKNEIPYSIYNENAVTIFFPNDSYRYEVVGTNEGSYDLEITAIAEEINTFLREKELTSTKAIHQYTIDWEALSEGKKGVTMKIDSNGDGTFEEVKHLGYEEGFPWVWVVVAGLSGLIGVLAGAFLVQRRIGRKQTA